MKGALSMAKKDLTNVEKLQEIEKEIADTEKRIKSLKLSLTKSKKKLENLNNEKKAIAFDILEEKAKANNQTIEDLL